MFQQESGASEATPGPQRAASGRWEAECSSGSRGLGEATPRPQRGAFLAPQPPRFHHPRPLPCPGVQHEVLLPSPPPLLRPPKTHT